MVKKEGSYDIETTKEGYNVTIKVETDKSKENKKEVDFDRLVCNVYVDGENVKNKY